jgi:hypothetical protein
MRRVIGRPLATALVLAACVAFGMLGATSAFGQVPERPATVGQPFSYSGVVYSHLSPGYPQLLVDPDHDACGGLSAGVHWGDFGAPTPVAYPAESALVSVPGGWNVVVSASYTYQAPKNSGGASVDIEITCDGQLQKEIYLPWVTVTVTGSSPGGSGPGTNPPGTNPPGSCPFPGTAQYPGVPCASPSALTAASKTIFRALGDAYTRGANFDKTFADEFDKVFSDRVLRKIGFDQPADLSLKQGVVTGVLNVLIKKIPPKLATGIIADMVAAAKPAYFLDSYKAMVLYRLAADPPDQAFHAFASPPHLSYPRVNLGGLPSRVARSTKRRLSRRARDAALHLALLTTIERAAGAALAGDGAAQTAQLHHAAGLASTLANLLASEHKWFLASSRALKRSGIHFRLPASAVRKSTRRPFAGADGRVLRNRLLQLGFSSDDLRAATRASKTVPLRRLTQFPAALGLAQRARDTGREIKALRALAERYAG